MFVWSVYQMRFLFGQFLQGQSTSIDLYDAFQQIHGSSWNAQLHGTSAFPPQHKAMIWLFESALIYTCQKANMFTDAQCCTLSLPYVYWLRAWRDVSGMTNGGYWADMDKLDAFVDPQYLGAARPGPGSYIDLGIFNKTGPFDSDGNDLKRSFTKQALSNTTNPKNIANWIVGNPTFKAFLPYIHGQCHGQFHTYVGFQMSNTFTAALDPIFWMHHTFVDYIYHVWMDCQGYEGITATTAIMPTHYVAQNPIGNNNHPTPAPNSKYYPDGTFINVDLNTQLDLWMTATSATFMPPSDFPTPAQMITCGPGGWGGINYRYGPASDPFIVSQQLSTRCPDKVWNLVNLASYS
jgi:hypothetical protein